MARQATEETAKIEDELDNESFFDGSDIESDFEDPDPANAPYFELDLGGDEDEANVTEEPLRTHRTFRERREALESLILPGILMTIPS